MSIELALIIIVAAFWIGWKASQMWHLISFQELLTQLKVTPQDLKTVARQQGVAVPDDAAEADADAEPVLPQLEIRIEQHPEGLFAYQLSDGLFIAQGRDREELMANLVHNLNNVRVIIDQQHGADLIQEKP